MARRRKGRPVTGILLLDKPYGGSSNKALQTAKRLYFAQKAGHTGSLDPMATGVLPICFGEATKLSQYLLNSDKAYTATITFGQRTNTADAEGEVIAEADASALTQAQVETAMQDFLGDIQQVPPMYSALKKDGQPLYKLAREGVEVEREARDVTIFEYTLQAFRPGVVAEADVYVKCSKGTYIRSLADDIGEQLGVGAHLTRLHRVQVGDFTDENCITLEQLEQLKANEAFAEMDQLLIPAEEAVNHIPLVEVTDTAGYYVRRGQPVLVPKAPTEGLVRIRQEDGIFLGIGEVLDDGRVTPRRLMVLDDELN